MAKQTFSKRFGHSSAQQKDITIREEAPEGLRGFIIMAFYDLNKKPSQLRQIVCRVLRIPPDSSNWSERPNIDYEVNQLLEKCEWFSVYDIIEKIIETLNPSEKEVFIEDVNEYFIINGIGWQIVMNKFKLVVMRYLKVLLEKSNQYWNNLIYN